jgi:hypothetical protein
LIATDPITDFLAKLEGVRKTPAGWIAKCPAHDDRHASLTVNAGDDDRVLVRCHAGCTFKGICAAAGIEPREMFPPRDRFNGNGKNGAATHKRIADTYDYLSAEGELLYQAVRYVPKGFTQRRPDGNGGWIWNMECVQRVLYHLPALLNSRDDDPDGFVFVCEGEKDANNTAAINLIATTNVGGAGKWKGDDGSRYADALTERRLVIVPHNDDPGRAHAQDVAQACHGKAAEVHILSLPGLAPKGDISDWIAAGGTREQLLQFATACPVWTPNDATTAAAKSEPPTVRQLLQAFPKLRPPVLHGLLRRGETMNVIAPPKTGKSWLVTDLAIAVATGRSWLNTYQTEMGNVLILDNELHGETTAARIPKVAHARGVLIDEFADRLFVENLRGRLRDIFNLRTYFDGIEPGRFKVIILDAMYRFMPRDTDENDNGALAEIYNQLDSYADRLGCCFVCIHHSTKGSQSDKAVTDVGAGAGSQSRATDTHLILRQHEDDGVVVLDAAVRSWAPIDPVCLRWDFPIWKPDPALDPTNLRRQGRRKDRKEETATPDAAKTVWTVELFRTTFISDTAKTEAAILTATDAADLSERKAKRLLQAGLDDGTIHRWTYTDRKKPHRFATVAQPITDAGNGVHL